MTTSPLDLMVEDLREHIPQLEIRYKDSSKFMKLLGFLLTPVNPTFMTKFVTTVGTRVYFPNRKHIVDLPTDSMAVLAHEFVHMWDEEKEGSLKYVHSYLSPQLYFALTILAYCSLVSWIPGVVFIGGYLASCWAAKSNRIAGYGALAATVVLAIASAWLFAGWWAPLALLAAFAPLAPWPSKGRTRLELRGYSMSVAVHRWLIGKDASKSYLDAMQVYFTGPAYYFMSRSPSKIAEALEDALRATQTGDILQEEPYCVVYDSLKKHGRLVD